MGKKKWRKKRLAQSTDSVSRALFIIIIFFLAPLVVFAVIVIVV